MCLILFSYDNHPRYKLILASNRDEFYDRPTRPLYFWEDALSEKILAGRDEKDKGTWLGVTPSGKISGITNFRSMTHIKEHAPSRGLLVSNYLSGTSSPEEYLKKIQKTGHLYNGFNLIVGDIKSMYYYSNVNGTIEKIRPGLYGLSNAFLDTAWPKVRKGKSFLGKLLSDGGKLPEDEIFELLSDREFPRKAELPETGVGPEWERILSPLFIESDIYGTRTSTVITIDYHLEINVIEKTYPRKETGGCDSEIVSKTINAR